MARKIEVINYSEDWPKLYQQESKKIIALFQAQQDSNFIQIEHIGSTSVIGLAAKPVIDILLVVTNIQALDQMTDQFAQLDYQAKGEYGIEGRRYFQKGEDQRLAHLHAFQQGNFEIKKHICFRDYLRCHLDVAAEYGKIKKNAAIICQHHREKYMALKHDFIQYHLAIAISEIS